MLIISCLILKFFFVAANNEQQNCMITVQTIYSIKIAEDGEMNLAH